MSPAVVLGQLRAGLRRYAATVAWWAALTGVALALAFVDSGAVRT